MRKLYSLDLSVLVLTSCFNICYTKALLVKKSKAKSEAPVTSIVCMRLKGVISGRGHSLLRFNHFVDAAIYNHVQTNRNNSCRQTIET